MSDTYLQYIPNAYIDHCEIGGTLNFQGQDLSASLVANNTRAFLDKGGWVEVEKPLKVCDPSAALTDKTSKEVVNVHWLAAWDDAKTQQALESLNDEATSMLLGKIQSVQQDVDLRLLISQYNDDTQALQTELQEIQSDAQDHNSKLISNSTAISQLQSNLGLKANASDLATKVDLSTYTPQLNALQTALTSKVDISVFTAFQTSNTSSINMKADSISTYTKTAVDGLLAPKLDTSAFNIYTASNSNALSQKADSISTYTKTNIDALLSGKLDISTFSAFQTTNTTAIGAKAPQSTTYTKSEVDSSVGVVQGNLNVYMSTNDASVGLKYNTSDFNAFAAANTSALNTKQPMSSNLSGIDQPLSTLSAPTFNAITLSTTNALNVQSGCILYANAAGDLKFRNGGSNGSFFIGADQNNPLRLGLNNTNTCYIDYASGCIISSAMESISTTSGALQVKGGTGIVGNLNVGGTLNLSNTGTSLSVTGLSSFGNANVLGLLSVNGTLTVNNTSDTSVTFAGGVAVTKALNVSGTVNLANSTSNLITFGPVGVAPPAFTTRSTGTKIIFYPSISSTTMDWAMGMENNTLWSSVTNTGGLFKWYGGTSNAMTLSGAGALTVPTVNATNLTVSGTLTCNALNVQNISTGTRTDQYVSFSGLTLTGMVTEMYYAKVGACVHVSVRVAYSSSTGSLSTTNNITLGTPFPGMYRNRFVTCHVQWYASDLGTPRAYYQNPSPANSVVITVDPTLLTNYALGGELYVEWVFYTTA